jgi:UTP--glucose-1-phosphate uridylyltransferase
MIKKAVILAGGLGTRFLPVTKSIPKEMLPVLNKPALQYIAAEVEESGIRELAILINDDKSAVRRHFGPTPIELEVLLHKSGKTELLRRLREICGIPVEFLNQYVPLGSGHAVLCARQFVGEDDFALLNGDDLMYTDDATVPVTGQLAACFARYGLSVIGVQRVPESQLHKYGVVHVTHSEGRTHFMDKIVEKPSAGERCGDKAALGRYVLRNDIFDYLEALQPAANGEIQLTDALNAQAARGLAAAYEFSGRRYDLGGKQGYVEANIEFGLRDPEIKDDLSDFLRTLRRD